MDHVEVTRWAIWFAVDGDARFLSHHDLMRVMERTAARAGLPLRHTQGFNPHPKISLALPKPVGLAGRRELMVLELEGPLPDNWPRRLGEQLPRGFGLVATNPLPLGKPPRVAAAAYEMDLTAGETTQVQARLAELAGMTDWPVQRRGRSAPDGGDPKGGVPGAPVELRGKVVDLAVAEGKLTFRLRVEPSGSARPGEVLQLLRMVGQDDPDAPATLARLVRTDIEYAVSPRSNGHVNANSANETN
jgi:radical SAM-linked protein